MAAEILKDGPIRKLLRERGHLKKANPEQERPLKKPVSVPGFTLRTLEHVATFKDLHRKISTIYNDYSERCNITHNPMDCIPTHILGDFMRKLDRAEDELREQGAW